MRNYGFLKLNIFLNSECKYVFYQDHQMICMKIKTYEALL